MSPRGEPRDRWRRFSDAELLVHYELMMRGLGESCGSDRWEAAAEALYRELIEALTKRGIVCPYPGGWD